MSSADWTVAVGALIAAACALPGCFLVLRRLAMLGDAISHAVLPGIVVAFMLTGSRASLPMFLGAAGVGLLTTFAVQALARGGVQGDAAIGVTFTALFAAGVVMVSRSVGNVDLDLDCVLHGEIAYAALDRVRVAGLLVPRAAVVGGGLLALNALVITLCYKELKLCAFDPGMAAAVGIPVGVMHYLLMALVSVTTVGSFESVGAILVVAMLVAPAATAYLLTERLSSMLVLAAGIGALSALLGYRLSLLLDCSVAGAMATIAGGLFALALLFSPRHGVVIRHVMQVQLRRRVQEEDLLLWAGRKREQYEPGTAEPLALAELAAALEWLPSTAYRVARRLARAGMLRLRGEHVELTEAGAARATALLRRHRIYESYLGDLGYLEDHLHSPADRVEHHLSPGVTAALEVAARHPHRDPQGKPIPPEQ